VLYAVVVDGRAAPREGRIDRAAVDAQLVTPAVPDTRNRGDRTAAQRAGGAPRRGDAEQPAASAPAGGAAATMVARAVERPADSDAPSGYRARDRRAGAGAQRKRGGDKRDDDRQAEPVPVPAPTTELPAPTPVPDGEDRGGGETTPGGDDVDEPDEGVDETDPERTAWAPEDEGESEDGTNGR
jgi:hypothetical protein